MVKSILTDGYGTGNSVKITNESDEPNALIVATRPLKTFDNTVRFFTNDEYGIDMNQNAGTGGTPEEIHNGTDDILWTASDIVGNSTTFDSTDQNHTSGGTMSIKYENGDDDDVFQLAKGSDIDMNNYVSITIWIYVDKDWNVGDSIEFYGWDTGTGTALGTSIKLEEYFSFLEYDIWHKITIPLTDMNLNTETTLDAVRFMIISSEGKSPKMYLDDIQIEESGNPLKYSLTPSKGTWLHIDTLSLIIAANIPSTLADATMPYLSYNNLLGITLYSGITYKREQSEETILTLQLNNLADFLQLPDLKITSLGSDGTNTFIKIDQTLTSPFILKPENQDILSYTVNDDLSDLLLLRISAGCRIEERDLNESHNIR